MSTTKNLKNNSDSVHETAVVFDFKTPTTVTRKLSAKPVLRFKKAMKDLGPAIKLARTQLLDISQEQLAKRLSLVLRKTVGQSYICHIERRAYRLSLERFLALCDALELEPGMLIALALHRRHFREGRTPAEILASIQEKLARR